MKTKEQRAHLFMFSVNYVHIYTNLDGQVSGCVVEYSVMDRDDFITISERYVYVHENTLPPTRHNLGGKK
jgi:hypothetical protein